MWVKFTFRKFVHQNYVYQNYVYHFLPYFRRLFQLIFGGIEGHSRPSHLEACSPILDIAHVFLPYCPCLPISVCSFKIYLEYWCFCEDFYPVFALAILLRFLMPMVASSSYCHAAGKYFAINPNYFPSQKLLFFVKTKFVVGTMALGNGHVSDSRTEILPWISKLAFDILHRESKYRDRGFRS